MRWNQLLGACAGVFVGGVLAGCSDGNSPNENPVPTTVTAVGAGQTAMAGTAVATPVGVTVKDQFGHAISGIAVGFAVSAGGGFVNPAVDTTNAQGVATTSWVLGSAVGAASDSLTATVNNSSGAPTVITASTTPVVSAYNISLRFLTPMTAPEAAAFNAAAARWSSIIVGDLPSDVVVANTGDCGDNSPPMNETVDDIVIFATIDSLDGPGNILGGAFPCWIRDVGSLTLVGAMVFDSADMGTLEANNILNAVILHEMGHVFGIGTLWTYMTPSLLTGAGTLNPYFTGAGGIMQFNMDGGLGYAGSKVPVENQGGPGTADGHWRESVMGRELMTGYISLNSNPLSTITIASLQDMGYTVSYANADPYTVSPLNLRMGPGAGDVRLLEMKPTATIKRVDAAGRILHGK